MLSAEADADNCALLAKAVGSCSQLVSGPYRRARPSSDIAPRKRRRPLQSAPHGIHVSPHTETGIVHALSLSSLSLSFCLALCLALRVRPAPPLISSACHSSERPTPHGTHDLRPSLVSIAHVIRARPSLHPLAVRSPGSAPSRSSPSGSWGGQVKQARAGIAFLFASGAGLCMCQCVSPWLAWDRSSQKAIRCVWLKHCRRHAAPSGHRQPLECLQRHE